MRNLALNLWRVVLNGRDAILKMSGLDAIKLFFLWRAKFEHLWNLSILAFADEVSGASQHSELFYEIFKMPSNILATSAVIKMFLEYSWSVAVSRCRNLKWNPNTIGRKNFIKNEKVVHLSADRILLLLLVFFFFISISRAQTTHTFFFSILFSKNWRCC